MRFRPCIDLRNGRVVQIVGGTLTDAGDAQTNFESETSAADFALRYRNDALTGGHVIMLGPGNEDAALSALGAYPNGMQVGGGVTPENAERYLDAGASHAIVTSYVFRDGEVDRNRLKEMVACVGSERLVLDLSCRRRGGVYYVVTNRWQTFTNVSVDGSTLNELAKHCTEFLVHGVDVEGRRLGIEEELVAVLGAESPIPVTYAGGARSMDDLARVESVGGGRVDLTIGSALDIFGGDVAYDDVVAWHRKREGKNA